MTSIGFLKIFPAFSLEERDLLSWFIALALSFSAHIVFILNKQKFNVVTPASVTQETITHVRFSTYVPPSESVVEPVFEKLKPDPIIPTEQEIVFEKTHESKMEKVINTEKPKPKIKPKPKKEKVPIKPVPVVKKKQVVQHKPTLKQTPKAKQSVEKSPVVVSADPQVIEKTRLSYHAHLMRHIEEYKHYPRVARKRKIQGDISVMFTLLADGSIKNLAITGKRSALKKATEQAIQNAQPMPKPPGQLSMPMEITFKMNYSLR
jgi:protein TonB